MTSKNLFFDQLLSNLPDGKVLTVQVGLFWTAVVLETGGEARCGLATTRGDESHHFTNDPAVGEAGRLTTRSARGLAEMVHSEHITERSIGMAAVNALLPRLRDRWTDINAEEVIAAYGAGKNVALVGHFPFVSHLKTRVGQLWVLELEPGPGDLPATAAAEFIPKADVLAITAMTLLNGTFDSLLLLRRPGTLTLVLGPTTPLSPLLFERSVDILSGAVVEDIDATLLGLAQGANFRQLHRLGVRLVSMSAADKKP